MILQQQRFQYRETVARLSGYCLLFHAYGEFRDTLSQLLYETKDEEQKERLLDVIEDRKHYLMADIGPDNERKEIRIQPRDTSKSTSALNS